MNEHLRLLNAGMLQSASGELRGACDILLASALMAPSVWTKTRFKAFLLHCMILRELHFKATNRDIKILRKKFLTEKKEPSHFRVQAAFALGVLESNRGDIEKAAEMYREGLTIAKNATEAEKKRVVASDNGPLKVSYLLEIDCKSIASNLSILNGTGRTLDYAPLRRDLGDQSMMPDISPTASIPDSARNMAMEDIIGLLQRATVVGGSECDWCHKTLVQLGKDSFECCSRCKMTCYCSKECQEKAWKKGHKQACRKPNEIHPGDYMVLKRLDQKPELNGKIVQIIKEAPVAGRWVVEDPEFSEKCLSIATKNLLHVRPEK